MNANEILNTAIDTMVCRAEEYDSPGGERSMATAVEALNAIRGRKVLSVSEGWLLMLMLKLSRDTAFGNGHQDSLVDLAAYAALYAEERMK